MNDTLGSPFRVLLATDDSDAARNTEAWVTSARWQAPCVVDVLCVAGRGITRMGWGMQTYPTAVRDAVEQLRQSEVAAAERIANEAGLRLQAAGWARGGRVTLLGLLGASPDLIVVARPAGRRRHDPFAENVTRYARTSVLVVPQP